MGYSLYLRIRAPTAMAVTFCYGFGGHSSKRKYMDSLAWGFVFGAGLMSSGGG